MSSEALSASALSEPVAYRTLRSQSAAEMASWGVQYALAIIFVWFGVLKFTSYEVSAVAPLLMNNPLVGWLIGLFGFNGTTELIGVFEIVCGLLLGARPFRPLLGMIGGTMAVITFLVTLSFMVTTPGVAQPGHDHSVVLSAMPGQFLLKDLVLLAVSLWSVVAAYEAFHREQLIKRA